MVGQAAAELPLPPLLEPRQTIDGYRIVRQVHVPSSRSHVYLAVKGEANGEDRRAPEDPVDGSAR